MTRTFSPKYSHNVPFRIVCVGLLSAVLMACDKPAPPANQGPPTVITTNVVAKSVPVSVKLPGRTAASVIAEVRPQVGGIILSQKFKEGGMVKEAMPLYQIDPATYEASLAQAQASLSRAEANQNAVKIKADRLRGLVKSNAVSKQEVDDVEALLLQANADVLAAKAVLDGAQINLNYTEVLAPISGQIGRSTVTQGALVTPAQPNQLATIQQLDPMKVAISYPSSAFVDIKQKIKEGKIKADTNKLSVTLLLENGTEYPHKGSVTFTDPTVDPSTGTILIQAEFPNPDLLLLPGMFVNTIIDQGVQENAISVPQKAVSRNSQGQAIVHLITKEGDTEKVAPQIVIADRSQGDVWVISSGLAEGDKIMVEGFGITDRMQGRGVVKTQDEHESKASAPDSAKQ